MRALLLGRHLAFILMLLFLQLFKFPYAIPQTLTIKGIKSQFATKTTYAYRIPIHNSLPWIKENIPKNLKPILLDATLRHGTRFPSDKRVKIFKEAAAKLQGIIKTQSSDLPMSKALYDSIKNWKNQFPDHSSYHLSSLGWEEQVELGFKYFSMMPDLWHQVLRKRSEGNLMAMTSSKVRVLATAKAFLNAIHHASQNKTLDSDHHSIQYEEEKVFSMHNQKNEHNFVRYGNISVHIDDNLLRFFDQCKKYVHTVDNNKTAEHEFETYFRSEAMRKIPQGTPGIMENKKDVYHIYQLCAFEMAIYGDSIWCQIFSDEDISALEYASDLKHYYKTGHGYAINIEQSCILLQNITDRIAHRNKEEMHATLRFGHAETLIPLVSLLEFYQEDAILQAHNSDKHTNRVFRTSKISPFSGNLAIILYESIEDKNTSISFVLNENIIKPFGLDCYFCDFGESSVVYKKLIEKLRDCHQVCDLEHKKDSNSRKDEL